MTTRRIQATGIMVAGVCVTGLAWAQWDPATTGQEGQEGAEGGGSDDQQRQRARDFMVEGRLLRFRNDHQGALKNFQEAHLLMGVPTTGLEVAQSQADLGQLLEARGSLMEVLRYPTVDDEPAPFQKARQRGREMTVDLATRIPTLRLQVLGLPANVTPTIEVDHARVDIASLRTPLALNPGTHEVVVRAEDRIERKIVELVERQVAQMIIEFPPIETNVEPKPPRPTLPPTAETETSTARTWLIVGGFGLAGVGLATGVTVGLVAQKKADELDEVCPNRQCPPWEEDRLESTRNVALVSTVGYSVAAVGAVLGVTGLLWSQKSPSTQEVSVRPWVHGTEAGLRGRFW